MKAITLTQPWATLVAIGAKTIETRSWGTRYRGELAIHAAKRFPGWARDLIFTDPFFPALNQACSAAALICAQSIRNEVLPLGKVIAVCQLVDCIRIEAGLGWEMRAMDHLGGDDLTADQYRQELAFGDYSQGRYMWLLGDVRPLEKPVPAKGSLRLWNWEGPAQ